MFIGRRNELSMLESKYHEPGGQLVVLYGRRRVGKTELLHQFADNRQSVFYTCTECADSSQLQSFSERILRAGHPASAYTSSFQNWEIALNAVATLPGEGRKILVIDEFPYMVKGNPSIPSILQKLWDTQLKDSNVMIILCGSAMSFIEKEILSEKNPLFGRATCIMKLMEMDYVDAADFFPNYSTGDKLRAYAILGGVPHYLIQFSDEIPLMQNITERILRNGALLYSEVEFLMRQEFRENAIYNTILGAVALGATQLNELHQKTQIEKTKLCVYLKNLAEVGLVRREFSMSEKLKEQGNVQRGLYAIENNFFRFWYAFVYPYISELDAGDAGGIARHVVAPMLDSFVSHPFEDICIQYLRRQNRAEALPFHFTQIGRWWSKTEELDVFATDALHKRFLVGDCKYKITPLELSDVENTLREVPPKAGRDVSYVFFSRSGFTKGASQRIEELGGMAVSEEQLLCNSMR